MNKTTYCFGGKAIGKLLFTLLFFFSINNMFSQTTIVSDGLNNSTSLFTLSGGAYYTGNSGTGDRVASSPFAVEGTHSYGLNATSTATATATMTTSNVNTTGYTGISATFRLAAFSIGSTANGLDAPDIVTVSVSPDGGTTYYSTVRVLGTPTNNAFWSYSGGTGVASTSYDGNATPVDFQPMTTGVQTTNGFSIVTVTGLPAITNLRVRITMTNNATSERWVVDDFKISGTVAAVAPEINVQGNSTNIVSGDTTPSTTDHTDFGSVNAASGSVVRTFTIQNTGTAALNISSAYLLDGTSGFSITSAPASSVAASGSTTIQVTFDPASAGTFNDEVVIKSDDANEGSYTFAITGVGFVATPEINVQGNSVSIVDGDTTPSTADHTDFGSVTTSSGSVVRTFTIQNTGTAALNISSANLLGGTSGFSITSAPASSVAAAGSTTIQVTFDPASAGTFNDELVIESDDADEATYTFAITGVGFVATPEINVQGNSVSIVDGDTTPSTADHTDFGSVTTSSGSVVRTFTIQNTGSAALNISDAYLLDGTSGFSITSAPASSVAASGSTTIQVTFDPASAGTFNDEVVIKSDDSDEATYTFAITGFGIAPQPEINVTGNTVSIVSGDVTPALADHTDFGSVGSTNTIVRTYTIQNTGDAPLVLGSPAVLLDQVDGFSVTQQPTSPVGVGSSTTFEITFTPSVAGVDTNTVLIDSNDANEGTYSFAITGIATVVAPVATAATSVGTSSFTANWNAVAGATSYEIDVYTIENGVGSNPASASWNFATATPLSAAGNATVSALSQGNNNGTTTLLDNNSASSGYAGASGGNNAGAAARVGALNTATNGSAFFQFSVTPIAGESVTLTGISFGTRSTSTGPQAYTLRSSLDNYATDIAIGTMSTGSWLLRSNTGLTVAGSTNQVITFRLYGYNGAGSPATNTANWRIDDLALTMTVTGTSLVTSYFLQNENVGNTTSYNVTGLNEGTTYYYVVRAISGLVETANSNEISATTGYAPVTWTGGAWSNVSGPTNLIDAVIADTYVTADDGEFTAKSLTVTTGGSLTVSSGDVVTVVGALDNELTSSAVVVENNGVLMQGGTSNLNTGSITVRRNSSAILRQDYTLWSSPVAGQGLYAFSPTTLPNRFYTYITSTNLYSNSVGFNLTGLQFPSPLVAPNGINGTDTNNVLFATAKGYLIRTPWNHPTAPTVFAGQFAGVPNSGDITYTMSLAGTGFNLVGNPYPSPISMETFVDDNAANITTSLYFWRETNGNTSNNAYCQWNDGLFQSNGQSQVFDPQNVIRTGQGFIVDATGAGTALVFNNGQRVANTANQFFRQNNTQDVYWLNLTNAEGAFSQTVVSYKDYASNGLDRYDGKNVGASQVSLSSLIDGQEYGIQGKAAFVDTDVVPMHLKVATAGNYTISIEQTQGLFNQGQAIYLNDKLSSKLHNFASGSYSFTSEAGTFDERFEVVYRDAALSVDVPTLTEKQVVIYKNQANDFVINTGDFEMSAVKVFDVRGRLLVEKQGINATQTSITAGLSNEVLLVQIKTVDGAVVTKKVIR